MELSKNVLPLRTSMSVTSISKGWSAETIRIARKALRLTQAELAELLGCRQQTISEWEVGMYTPKNAYQKLLDQFFAAKEGVGGVQDGLTSAPAVFPESPAPKPNLEALFFTVTAEELEGAAKHMRELSLGKMQIQYAQAQATFNMFGLDDGVIQS